MNKKNVSCKNINWQWFPRLAHAWDVLWYDIVSVDQIAHGKCDCRTVILAIIFYRSLVSESSITGLGVYTRRWVYDNITPHSLCYLARVRPVDRTIHTISAKALGPCVTRISTAMVLFIQDNQVRVFNEKVLQQFVPSQCWEMILYVNIFPQAVQQNKHQNYETIIRFVSNVNTLWYISWLIIAM